MKYTPARVKKIIEGLRNQGDMNRCEVVKKCGICYAVYMEWQRKYPEFKALVDQVDAENYERDYNEAIKCVRNKFKDNLKAATWFLERTDPEHFGRSEKIEQDLNISGVDITYIKPNESNE